MNIAFMGQQCAGKTEAANYIAKKLGYKPVKFIDKLYQINKLLGVNKNRGFMQDMGELIRKYFGRDFFVYNFMETNKNKNNLVSDDVRKLIELEAVQNLGFVSVFIEADENIRKQRATNLGLEFIPNHPAELEISEVEKRCMYKIYNNSTFDDFYEQIDRIIKINLSPKYKEHNTELSF